MGTTARECADAPPRTAKWQASFESLARRFYPGVYNYLCWLSRDTVLAEDVTQETFMRVWQHPPELRGNRALKAWIFRVARNEYLQHRRRAGLDTIALEECDDAEAIDWSAPSPQVLLERAELCQAVRAAVEGLPDLYREVIVLHNLDELSLTEVAQVLAIPVGTVKSRRAKAFVTLRNLLSEMEARR